MMFFLLFLASCQNNSQKQTININFHSEPASLDPRATRDLPSNTVCRLLYDGLFRMGENGPTYALAQSHTLSTDEKTYTFKLRDALWNDGSCVTAFDFESTWKSTLCSTYVAEEAPLLYVIKNAAAAKRDELPISEIGVWAEDEKTLIVTLEYPYPCFLELLAHPITYPYKEQALQNGPFQLVRWKPGCDLIVEKNPTYWDAQSVRLEQIIISMIEDEHTELNMYEQGELDWAGSPNSSIPPEALPSLKKRCKDELFMLPIAGTYCYKFNTLSPPFNSQKIRQAFSMGINRTDLIDNILQANQVLAAALIPPCISGETAPKIRQQNALELFEAGLSEMGWTRETMPPITLMFSRSEKHQKVAQVVQQQWNKLFGIKVSLQSFEWNIFLERLNHLNYQVGGRGYISTLSDPSALLELYRYTNNHPLGCSNDTGWSNPKYTSLLELAKKTTSHIARAELLGQAEELILEHAPIAPLYHSTACYLKKPYLQGVYISKMCDIDFKHAYIDYQLTN